MRKKFIDLIFNILATPYHIIGYIPRVAKILASWFVEVIKETIAQVFTILGFFIAWLTLTGSSKDIVGIAILCSITLWIITIGFRKEKSL